MQSPIPLLTRLNEYEMAPVKSRMEFLVPANPGPHGKVAIEAKVGGKEKDDGEVVEGQRRCCTCIHAWWRLCVQVMMRSGWSGPTWIIRCSCTPAMPTLYALSPDSTELTGRVLLVDRSVGRSVGWSIGWSVHCPLSHCRFFCVFQCTLHFGRAFVHSSVPYFQLFNGLFVNNCHSGRFLHLSWYWDAFLPTLSCQSCVLDSSAETFLCVILLTVNNVFYSDTSVSSGWGTKTRTI